MIGTVKRPLRGLVAISVVVAIAVAGCGSSSSTSSLPGGITVPSVAAGGSNGGGSLSSGLAANLDKLDSYKFTETMSGTSFGAGSSDNSGTNISGTVINKPDHRMFINFAGTQYIVIGSQQWVSSDGTNWTDAGSGTGVFETFLPGQLYGTWFDSFASDYQAAGEETQNNVLCIHYKGNSTINTMYSALAGVSGTFTTDLWVAKDGGYPVKGVLAMSASSGGQGGSFGYTLDVTNVNDASNAVVEPSVAPAS